MKAIFVTGGKQYYVAEGDEIFVEKIDAEVGKEVKKGDVVCIIEAMKLMNEIESEFSGKVLEFCVEDGQPVEFGQVLMYIEE